MTVNSMMIKIIKANTPTKLSEAIERERVAFRLKICFLLKRNRKKKNRGRSKINKMITEPRIALKPIKVFQR